MPKSQITNFDCFSFQKLKFADDQAGLKTGQLVKDEYFTLFEAVGALEV
jgi:hypothetical protein